MTAPATDGLTAAQRYYQEHKPQFKAYAKKSYDKLKVDPEWLALRLKNNARNCKRWRWNKSKREREAQL
jgi:hypothetical protein